MKMVEKKQEDDIKNFKVQIEWSVDTLMTLIKSFPRKNSLLDDGDSIFLQVTLFKIPQVDEMVKRRLSLKHSPYAGKPEVCFIVRDSLRKDRIKRTPDEMIDHTIQRFEDFFIKQKVTGITNILPFYQLKTEYNTHELRRKLVNRFDVFLCTSSLNAQNFFFQYLGKPFIQKNKFPVSVKLPPLNAEYDPKINKQIQYAIRSTVFRVREGSDNYSIRIGHTLNKKKDIKENLECILDKIVNSDFIPGGLENIRLMGIKSGKSKLIPLYISMNSGGNVRIPYLEPNHPVKESVEGELSTIPGKKVTVLPSGEIFVTPMKEDDDEEEENDDEISEDDNEKGGEKLQDVEDGNFYRETKQEFKGKLANKKGKSERDDEDEEDEEEIESFEQKYLSDWNANVESSEEEEEEEVKTQKGRKRKRSSSGEMAKMKKENRKPPHKAKRSESPKIVKKKEANKVKSETISVKKTRKDETSASKWTNKVKNVDKKTTEIGKTGKKLEKKANESLSMKADTAKQTKKQKILDANKGKNMEAKGEKKEKVKAIDKKLKKTTGDKKIRKISSYINI